MLGGDDFRAMGERWCVMRRNKNGIAVPGVLTKLPFASDGNYDAEGLRWDVYDATKRDILSFGYREDAEFLAHAANYHARLAEIVRRFSEWHDQDDDTIDILPIVTDAATLWKKYQEEPK